MSTPAAQSPPPAEPTGIWGKITSAPRRFMRLSLAARAAWSVALSLLVIAVVAWSIFLVDPASVPWRHSMTVSRIVTVLCLLVVIPLVVYQALRLWLDGDVSPFPDIDYAWKAGIAALERNGLDLQVTPLFVVLGSSSSVLEKTLFDASGITLRVREIPAGPAALHWYANPEGVYLFCTDAGWLAALSQDLDRRADDLAAIDQSRRESVDVPDAAALAPAAYESPMIAPVAPGSPAAALAPSLASSPAPAAGRGQNLQGTVAIDPNLAAQILASGPTSSAGGSSSPVGAAARTTTDSRAGRGTVMLNRPLGEMAGNSAGGTNAGASAAAAPVRARTPTQPPLLPAHVSAQQLERLNYVCQLIRQARQPLCPINGIMTLLDLRAILAGPRESDELQRAAKHDLATMQHALQLRCPVNALVYRMENEPGFRELVRRVGRERAALQRFGRGFDPRSPATTEELAALSAHVCGSFEDWVYTLFREEGALHRPGNTRLYGLLCKVRTILKDRLTDILVGGFGYDPREEVLAEPLLFSGCYLAATGATEDRQAFIRSVLDKLVEDAESIEWTPGALQQERRYAAAAYTGLALAFLAGVVIVGLVLFRAWSR